MCINSHSVGLFANATAGIAAEVVSAFSYLPTDVISQRLQIRPKVDFLKLKYQCRSSTQIAKSIWKAEGIRGFFRGFWPYMIVFGPGSAVWWAGYECTKSSWNLCGRFLGLDQENAIFRNLNHLFSGAVAGVASCVATNPLDVARTRIQLFEFANAHERETLSRGFFRLLKNIYVSEGIQGLYKGMKPRLYAKIPGFAVAFLGYEYLKNISQKEESK